MLLCLVALFCGYPIPNGEHQSIILFAEERCSAAPQKSVSNGGQPRRETAWLEAVIKGMRDDFVWIYTDEPHATRRREILKKYPEIRKLFGYEPKTKYIVLGLVTAQLITSYLIRNSPWWWIIVIAYVWGGTLSHSLNLAIHEISHNLAFPMVSLHY